MIRKVVGPGRLSVGRCSRSGVPDHVGRPGIVVQTPQLEHNLSVATGEARRRGSSRNGTFARPTLHGRTRRPTAYAAPQQFGACLLYTSDAADDLLCVDLGG